MAIIKADLEGSVRLAEISADQLTVEHVRTHLGEVYDKPLLEGFELYYVADGEELVLIDSDEEFLAGLCENGSPFRVTIVPASHHMQSLASCGLSLLEEAERVQSDDAGAVHSPRLDTVLGVHALEAYEREEDDDESLDEDDDQLEDSDDSDDDDDEEEEAAAVKALPFAPPTSGSDSEPAAEEKPAGRGKNAGKKKGKKARREQLSDDQLFELATQRLRQSSPDLAELQVEQLQAFMGILQFEFKKLAKSGVLSPAEVGPSGKQLKNRKPKTKRPIDLPAACVQALRAGGLVASDATIAALVNVIRVQPKRFRKLGLLPSSASSEGEECRRRWGRMHHHGGHGRGRECHGREETMATEEEWIAALPDNNDVLFEQAALRTETDISGADLKSFMRVVRLPFERLQAAGLLSEMEMRGDGTGSDQLSNTQPKSNPGLAHRAAHHAPAIAEALQAHDVVLAPATVQRLMEVLRVRPCRFMQAGVVDQDGWQQRREQFRQQRRANATGGFGSWFAQMLGMSNEPRPAHPHHRGPHQPPHVHGHHHHHPHHGPHHHHPHHGPHHHHPHHGPHHGPRHFPPHGHPHGHPHHPHFPHAHPFGAHPLFAHAMPAPATPTTPPTAPATEFAQGERRFPTNASMAQIANVEGRQPGKVVSSGVRFEQRWKVQNNHTHPWPAVVEIVPDNEDALTLGVTEPVTMSIRVQPQQSVDIAIIMDAPTAPGLYRPRFRLRDGHTGLAFGQRLTGEVLVVDPNQPQQHEPQLPPRSQHGGQRRRRAAGAADY